MITYDWSNPKNFFNRVREKLSTKEMRDKIKRANFWFEFCSVALVIFHVFMAFGGVYYDVLPAPLMVLIFVMTRTSMAGVGHYHCHRKKDNIANWGDTLFDL